MRGFYPGVLFLLICWAPFVNAHDIGVSQAELIEQDGQHYELSVQVRPAFASIFATPQLPAHCKFTSNPKGMQGTARKTFKFVCSEGLTADHTLVLPWQRDGIMLSAKWLNGSEAKQLFTSEAGRIKVPLAQLQAGSGSWTNAVKRYTGLGIKHILQGFDHLLFVLALLLIVRSNVMLIKTITAFTVAHSITLALATLGVVQLPSRPVEAAIALSIIFLSLEIIRARHHHFGLTCRYPWLIAFIFGLLHGLGFAGALADIGLPQSEIPGALLFFNIGVEIGQLLFVFSVLLFMRSIKSLRLETYNWVNTVPVYFIGILATYWFIQRFSMMLPLS